MATITQEQAQAAYQEWVKALNLSEDQKAQFHTAIDAAVAKLNEMDAAGQPVDPDKAKQLIRSSVEKWLTPEQLVVWDKGVANAKSLLGI
jgi:Spy/CpxP family protein refolding chaperone